MKMDFWRQLVLFFVCSGFWVLLMQLVTSFIGMGFAQNQPPEVALPPFAQQFTQQQQQTVPQQQGQITQPPQVQPLVNNAPVPNLEINTYNTSNGEVSIPFQVDTSRLLAFSVAVDSKWQQLTVLDPIGKTIAVYQISLADGLCYFKSARNIEGDLKMLGHNATTPYPQEIKSMLEKNATH